MDAAGILALQRARWRRPGSWAVLLGWTLISAIPPVLPYWERFTAADWAAWMLTQSLTYATIGLLGPAPWLWSGAPGGMPSFRRGIAQALALGMGCLLAVLLLESARHAVMKGLPFLGQLRAELAENTLIYLATFLLIGGGVAAVDRESERRAEAERREKEAQWVLLRGQLSPHVLFNGMNNLARLVRKDPDRAERAAEDMAELFRRLLDHAHRHLSPLREERELVERYLSLEALRFGPRLSVTWDWDPALDALEAPPFLLQPLVENALKHGLAPSPEGGSLHVEGRIHDRQVQLAVTNTGASFQGRGEGGLGLRNLEARLALAFQEAGTLSLEGDGARTLAQVAFPRLEAL